MSAPLYALGDDLEAVYDALAENGGDLTDELAAALDAAQGAFDGKAERVGLMVRSLLAHADAVDAEAKRLSARAAAAKKAAEGLKGYLHAQLVRLERREVKGALVTLRVQASPASARCTIDPAFLPAPLTRQIPARVEFDARAALAAHKSGVPLPDGVEIVQGTHLRVV